MRRAEILRDLAAVALVVVCATLTIKCAQVALTPDFLLALERVGAALVRNVVVQALGITLAFCALVWLVSAGINAMDRDYERRKK